MAASTCIISPGDIMSAAENAIRAEDHHASLMDRVYRYQRHFYDATRKYFLLGRDRLIAELAPGEGQRVLEIGCGTGRNLIHAARRFPQAHFYGLDISSQMLETARANIERAGLSGRISLYQGDATSFTAPDLFGLDGFDRVFCSYSLSMIPDWRAALDRGMAATLPSGELHALDFGQQLGLSPAFRGLLRWWLARFHVQPRIELADSFRELAARHGDRPVRFVSLYRDYCWSLSSAPVAGDMAQAAGEKPSVAAG